MSTDSQQPFVQPYGPPKTFAPQEMPPELVPVDPYRPGAHVKTATPVHAPVYGQGPPAAAYGQAPPPPPGYAPAGTAQYALQGYPPPAIPQGGYPPPAYTQGGFPGGQYGGFQPALAPWRVRFGAYFIDYLVTYVCLMLANIYSRFTAGDFADPSHYGTPTAVGNLVYLLGVATAISLWIWNRGILQGGTGQSLGKRSAKTRLVSAATGQPIGVGTALLRDVAHVLDSFLWLGFLWPLWDEKRQTFADKICSTLVVRD